MGYTHYWYRPKELNRHQFAHWAEDVTKILASSHGVQVRSGDGKGSPVASQEEVHLNGDGATGAAHESFFVPQSGQPESYSKPDSDGLYFEFCKTAHKPYDVLVVACLIRLKFRFPEVRIDSDGDESDWADDLKLCSQIFAGESVLPTFSR